MPATPWIVLASHSLDWLADFSKRLVEAGMPVQEAVIEACRARTRPIMITALALVMGSSVIITDPIFQGMAITLMFGVIVSTLLTLVVIPLKCVHANPNKVYGCNGSVNNFEAVTATGTASAPHGGHGGEKGNWKQGRIRLLWIVPAMLGVFLWTAVTTFVDFLRRQKWWEKVGPIVTEKIAPALTMAGYVLRALPYFVMLFVKDTVARLRERFAKTPEPEPAPASGVKNDPQPAPVPAPVKKVPVAKKAPVKKAPVKKKSAAKKPAAKKPAIKKPAIKKPAIKKPAAKKSATKTAPAAKKSAAKTAPAKKPAVKKPAVKTSERPIAKVRPKAKRRGIRLKPQPGQKTGTDTKTRDDK